MNQTFRINYADWLTMGNVAFGSLAIVSILLGKPMHAASFIIIGSLFDLIDGWVASRIGARGDIQGKAFDALADIITFGVAPAMLVFSLIDVTANHVLILSMFGFVAYIEANIFRHVRIFKLENRVLGPTNASLALLISLIVMRGAELDEIGGIAFLLIGSLLLVSERPYFDHHAFEETHMNARPVFFAALITICYVAIFALPFVRYAGILAAIAYIVSGQIRPLLNSNQAVEPRPQKRD